MKITINIHLLLIIFLSLLLNFIGLFVTKPLYVDEAKNWEISQEGIANIIKGKYDGFQHHPPIFYLFTHFWIKINDNETLLRLPGAISTILSTYLIFLIFLKLFNRKIALLSSFLFATSTYHIIYALQFRVNPLLTFLSLIYIYFFICNLNTTTLLYWFIFTCLGILLINLDYSFFWLFISSNIYYFFYFLKNRQKELRSSNLRLWIFHSISLFINFIYYLHRIAPVFVGEHWVIKPNIQRIFIILQEFIQSESKYNWGLDKISLYLSEIITLLFVLIILKETFGKNSIKKLFIKILIYIPIFTSFLISQFYPILINRNIGIASIGIIGLLALGFYKS